MMRLPSMAVRIGIELSPAACRLVELDGKPLERGVEPKTRVHSFAVLPRTGPELEAKLRSFRRRAAAVVIWGVGSDHRQVVVNNGPYDRMRREALEAARDAGVDTQGRMADIAPAGTRVERAARQPVVLALANSQAVSEAIQPLLMAGLRIHSVATPADALTSLARTRQAFAAPGDIEAYVALEETVTCIALVRDGALVSARELSWGYCDRPTESSAGGELAVARGEDIALRLADAVHGFVAEIGASANSVRQVSICGGLPNLRTMSVSLMERLDVEVETLDSLFGIDAERLPNSGSEFRERAAELRLAWAAAAAGRSSIDLTRDRRQRARNAALARAAIVAGVAAGLGMGLFVERTDWGRPKRPRTVAVAAPVKALPTPASKAPAPKPPVTPAPKSPVTPTVVQAPAPTPLVARAPAPAAAKPPIAIPPPAPIPAVPAAPTVTKPVAPVERPRPLPAPIVAPPPMVPTPPVAAPVARDAPIMTRRSPAPPAPVAIVAAPIRSGARTAPKATAETPPTPLDATLGTILYSTDRRLAIIDGRILGRGDEVKGARIVDITPTTVLLRDAQGRLRSLTLGAVGR
jgi:hypothetical protein